MGIQEAFVGLIFVICLYFLIKKIIGYFNNKSSCGSGCSKCALDVDQLSRSKKRE